MATERPILFSSPMVLAILSGRKTQTRRVIKASADRQLNQFLHYMATSVDPDIKCPYGEPGDRLWVRESFAPQCADIHSNYRKGDPMIYRADYTGEALDYPWKPSIHMPRWASRITLEITGVRAERLQQISDQACCREIGAPLKWDGPGKEPYQRQMRTAFANLWDSINAKRGYGWNTNPWVWVIEFKKVDGIA
jgi:hypothetical protein